MSVYMVKLIQEDEGMETDSSHWDEELIFKGLEMDSFKTISIIFINAERRNRQFREISEFHRKLTENYDLALFHERYIRFCSNRLLPAK